MVRPRSQASDRADLPDRKTPEQWMKLFRDLPDVRWAKVAHARRRVAACCYDDDCVEDVLEPLASAVGVSLRDDPG